MEKDNLIEFKNISKNFGGITALKRVSFEIRRKTIHGLVGENGAGKSTLIKICSGALKEDEGIIIFEGQEADINAPYVAEKIGISVVHQEVPFCPNLSVAGNIFLGDLITRGAVPRWDKMFEKSEELFEQLGVEIDPEKKIKRCSPGERQLSIIAKSLRKDAKLIILDEPTSSLGKEEVETLFEVLRKLKKDGVTILFVSHHLEEIKAISDRVSGLRDGNFVGTLEEDEITIDKLTDLIIGDKSKEKFSRIEEREFEEEILRVENFSNSSVGIEDISFSLNKSEILGITGLRGAGKTELAQSILGVHHGSEGEIWYKGEKIDINSPLEATEMGIGYMAEERKIGMFPDLNVTRNMIPVLFRKLRPWQFIRWENYNNLSQEYIKDLYIDGETAQLIKKLSGGNQQKALLAKWLMHEPYLLILDEPTRGIDIGAKGEIKRLIYRLSQDGISFILLSSDIDELLDIVDRMMVMRQRRIVDIFEKEEISKEKIMVSAVK